jgi:glycosyltransferase involved in cell wall biosynthesis/predicted metal-dependent phosphoesterase TrpH
MARCDLHVHSVFSTDSGNYALQRARLGESYTAPERVYRVCKARGMDLVTISDHNTLEGALRIAHLPDAFVSIEVTTRFPSEEVPLHVLVWNLSEEDHRDLQPYRPSVFELVAFLRERGLAHGLAHPLYRMGTPLTVAHMEQLLVLFSIWEGRNGARSRESNELACRLATSVNPETLARLADRHGLDPAAAGRIALTGGSDDHGALDIATTWTEAPAPTPEEFLSEIAAGYGGPAGAHGSTTKLAHALTALLVNAYRAGGGQLPELLAARIERLFDTDGNDGDDRHSEISGAMGDLARVLGERARAGGVGLSSLPGIGGRLGAVAFAAALQAPYLATAHHHADSRGSLRAIERGFFGIEITEPAPHALVFTDTFAEVNGVAGTMRQLAAASAAGQFAGTVVTAGDRVPAGAVALRADWVASLPGYESLALAFPVPTDVLACAERERPDVVHVATPGPVGLCGLAIARLLGIPVVGSYHTELGPYALHLTRDLLVAQATEGYVDWFYRQCASVLAPTASVAAGLRARGYRDVGIWGRGVDHELFHPRRRDDLLRSQLLDGADALLLSVGRISHEKRLDTLLQAYACLTRALPSVRLLVVGDGPARRDLERTAPAGVAFYGEARDEELARLYAAADLFCFSSTTDTFGQVLLEAAASGLPVVAAAAGGALDLVADRRTGVLVPPDDTGAFAAALIELLEAPATRAVYSAAARSAAIDRGWEPAIAQLSACYRRASGAAEQRVPVAA